MKKVVATIVYFTYIFMTLPLGAWSIGDFFVRKDYPEGAIVLASLMFIIYLNKLVNERDEYKKKIID